MIRSKNVSFRQYLYWSDTSASDLKEFMRSPMHYQAHKRGQFKPPSLAMTKGTAVHAWLEGDEVFRNAYVVAKKIDRRTNAGKVAFAAFQAEHEGKTVLSADDYADVKGMVESVRREPKIRPWLDSPTAEHEVSYRWTHRGSGLPCKCRSDLDEKEERIVLDFKTTQDASLDGFCKSIRFFKYDLSAVHYMEGTGCERYGWIAVESSPPYAACLYWLEIGPRFRAMADLRERELDRLAGFIDRVDGLDWPSYHDGECDIVW